MQTFLTRTNRKRIYAVCLAAVPLLVVYGVIDEAAAPLWIAVIGAVVAPTLALANLTPVATDAPEEDGNG